MEDRFRSKGLKGLILYLLVMIRDDAGLELDDREYRLSFRVLRDIEIEMEGLVKSEV